MIFDLIAGMSGEGSSSWTPADLFKNGELGFWFDASDLTTLFQDSGETVPVTASGQPVGLWKNKIAGNPGTFKYSQTTTSRMPILNITSGKNSLMFDGVDDRLTASAANLPTPTTGAGVGIGFEMNSLATDLSLFNWSSSSADYTKADQKITSNLFFTSVLSSNTVAAAGAFNSLVMSSSTTQAINAVLNTILSAGGTTFSVDDGVSINGSNLPHTSNAKGIKISQFVFINRALTPVERGQLETFIRSKQ